MRNPVRFLIIFCLLLSWSVCLPAQAAKTSGNGPTAAFSRTVNDLTVTITDASTGSGPLSWLWDFGDGNTSTLQNPTHTYSMAGFYLICLYLADSCGGDTLCMHTEVFDSTIGVGEDLQQQLRVWPNPARSWVQVSMPENGKIIALYDAAGRKIEVPWMENRADYLLDLRNVRAGMYFVEIETGGQRYRRRFLKTN